jgi:Transglycosylase-like domain
MLGVSATTQTSQQQDTQEKKKHYKKQHCGDAENAIRFYRTVTWTLQDKIHQDRLHTAFPERKKNACSYKRYAAKVWHRFAKVIRKQYQQYRISLAKARSLYAKWECIHQHEGAWNSNTGNGYYGGLQMDIGFQRAYGSEFLSRYGTADRWPIRIQLVVAERAYKSRGFEPWPNTARMCGLA